MPLHSASEADAPVAEYQRRPSQAAALRALEIDTVTGQMQRTSESTKEEAQGRGMRVRDEAEDDPEAAAATDAPATSGDSYEVIVKRS